MKILAVVALTFASSFVQASDFLIKFRPGQLERFDFKALSSLTGPSHVEPLSDQWVHVTSLEDEKSLLEDIQNHPDVLAVQPNYKLKFIEDYKIKDVKLRNRLFSFLDDHTRFTISLTQPWFMAPNVDPQVPFTPQLQSGADPLLEKQWGMESIQAPNAWENLKNRVLNPVTVAVLDSGVDYTHEDLQGNLWRNPGEIPSNFKDDDNNGYIDDVIGWDFVQDDNKPYDVTVSKLMMLVTGGNPGHGTHCAGNIGAVTQNSKGIAGVAPQVRIMSLRFISEKGQGDTAAAVKSIMYAVKNGAKVLSNSWGSEGEDPKDDNKALRDAIQFAQDNDVLFVAAAGNGREGKGFDNDTDANPAYPASYSHDNIISVAAIDSNDQLAGFSNFGAKSVDIAAPGVKVFSTVVKNQYASRIVESRLVTVDWDGTSMAAPHVAGAAALIWAAHPEYKFSDVKNRLLSNVTTVNNLEGKVLSGGKLNVGGIF